MATQAVLVSGDVDTVSYTRPEAAVAAGDVVIVGTIAGVDVCGGPADEEGALAVTGVWRLPKITEQAFAVGSTAYWNATEDPASGLADGTGAVTANPEDYVLGAVMGEGAEDGLTVLVKLSQDLVPSS